MSTRLATWFLLVMLAAPVHAACPPRPDRAQLQQSAREDEYFLRAYAISRLLACGFAQARADLELALPSPGADVSAFGPRDADDVMSTTHAALAGHVLSLRPRELVAEYARAQRTQSVALRLTPAGHAAAAARLEQDIPALVALLRERLPAEELAPVDTYFERVLIAHDVRIGQFAQARERLDRLGGDPRLREDSEPGRFAADRQWVDETRAVLADTPVAAAPVDWVLNLTVREADRTGADPLIVLGCALLPAGLRADRLLWNGDRTGAIEVLLRNEWTRSRRYEVSCRRQLLPLLRERHTADALRAGWRAAEESIRVGGADNGFLLYGVDLPLPRAALVHDTVAREFVERPLTREQATALMRKSDLYHALFKDTDAAR